MAHRASSDGHLRRVKFLDLAGLSPASTPAYVQALGLDDTVPVYPEHRLVMLKRLREGAGVRVYTGPSGAAFWLPASIEVHVNVVPDDYELRERCAPDMEWALQAVGVSPILARGLTRKYANTCVCGHFFDGHVDRGQCAERVALIPVMRSETDVLADLYRDVDPVTYADCSCPEFQSKEPTRTLRLYDQWRKAKELLARYEQTVGETIVVNAHHIEAVTDPAEQLALLDRVQDVAMDWEWDIETLDPEGLSVATADRTWYLPVVALDYQAPHGHGDALRKKVADVIRRTRTVWHNAKADLGTQWPGDPLDAYGTRLDDTLVAAFVAGEHDLALKPLVRRLLGRDPLDFPGAMRTLPLATGTRYGGADARNTYDLGRSLQARLAERQQTQIYTDIERPIIPLLTSMERYGHPVDPTRLAELRDNFTALEDGLRSLFWQRDRVDISKDADIRALVKRRWGFDPGSVKRDVLSKIEGDWMDGVIGYRQIRHRRRGFLTKHYERWVKAGRPDDFRLYAEFTQAGRQDEHDARSFKRAPRSGRLSSGGGDGLNFQNQPGDIRDIFIAPAGHVVWAYDYNQLEIRIAAARSGDPAMIAAALSGDFHRASQQNIYQLTGQWIEKPVAKQRNFNANYGGYLDQLRNILQKARIFISDELLLLLTETHKQEFPAWYTYGEDVVKFARMTGCAETAYGRRRYDDDLFSSDNRAALHAERALINHTIQGTAADMLKIAMRLAVPVMRKYGAHLAIQAHDELEGWVPEEAAADFDREMKAVLSSLTLPGMTFSVSGGYGRTWDEAKGG